MENSTLSVTYLYFLPLRIVIFLYGFTGFRAP